MGNALAHSRANVRALYVQYYTTVHSAVHTAVPTATCIHFRRVNAHPCKHKCPFRTKSNVPLQIHRRHPSAVASEIPSSKSLIVRLTINANQRANFTFSAKISSKLALSLDVASLAARRRGHKQNAELFFNFYPIHTCTCHLRLQLLLFTPLFQKILLLKNIFNKTLFQK